MVREAARKFNAFVGKRIADRRKKKGMSQRAFATKIGVSSSTLDRMEHGTVNITLDQLVRLAQELAPMEELLGLPHYYDAAMVDYVNHCVLAMSEEQLRDWKQNTEPVATDHHRIFILDTDGEQE
jgi:transcriptional regulator with XRE-family HTH domain